MAAAVVAGIGTVANVLLLFAPLPTIPVNG